MLVERVNQREFWGDKFFSIFAKGINVEGRENLSLSPPYIVAFNHMGWAEAIALYSYFPEPISFFSKKENFEILGLGWLMRKMKSIPVRRGAVDRKAIKEAITLLESGGVLGIAPEGTRGRGQERTSLKPGKKGIFYIATRVQVPVVPVAVWGGTEDIFPLIDESEADFSQRLLYLKRGLVEMRIGQPFVFHLGEGRRIDAHDLAMWTEGLMIEIGKMLPQEYHGYYADLIRESQKSEEV
ncbi:MAG: lysophospholipid acyltransferase family protein [Candidatus Shapirobacteria bacterium]